MSDRRPDLRDLFASPWHLPAFGFGTGLVPWAPGTFGSLVGLPLFWLIGGLELPIYLALTLMAALVGIPMCERAARHLQTHDHPSIVWDEVVGMLVTLIAAPVEPTWMLAGFVLFRFFDILKPWPIRWLDRHVHGGLGIMLDDLLAGLFAAGVLHVGMAWLSPA